MLERCCRRAALARLFCICLLIISGCGHTQPRASACATPPPGIGPDANASLQNADNGKTYCVKVGEIITIFLRVPIAEASNGWSPLSASGSSLEPMNTGVMTLVRGVRAAIYKAGSRGTAVLQSTRRCSGCTPSSWSATLIVR